MALINEENLNEAGEYIQRAQSSIEAAFESGEGIDKVQLNDGLDELLMAVEGLHRWASMVNEHLRESGAEIVRDDID